MTEKSLFILNQLIALYLEWLHIKRAKVRETYPFLFISPSKRLFAFIEWNSRLVWHSFNEIDKESVQVYKLLPEYLTNYSSP